MYQRNKKRLLNIDIHFNANFIDTQNSHKYCMDDMMLKPRIRSTVIRDLDVTCEADCGVPEERRIHALDFNLGVFCLAKKAERTLLLRTGGRILSLCLGLSNDLNGVIGLEPSNAASCKTNFLITVWV